MGKPAVTKYRKGEILLRQGDPDKCLYKLLSGKVALYTEYGQPEEYLVGILSSPGCFGELTIFAGQPSGYTVVALSDVLALRVTEENLEAFLQNNQQNVLSILKTMAKNLFLISGHMKQLVGRVENGSGMSAVDAEELRRLADRCLCPEVEAAPTRKEEIPAQKAKAPAQPETPTRPEQPPVEEKASPELSAPPQPQPQGGPAEFYLPGHRGYSGVTHPEYKNYIFKKEYICPHCGRAFDGVKIFQSRLVRSLTERGKPIYDRHVAYKNFETEWYEIITCPHCYFSAFTNVFLEPDILKKEKFEKRLAELRGSLTLDFEAERDLEFVFAQHYLALVCSPGLADSRRIDAHLWMNLLWLYKGTKDEEAEKLATEKALEANKLVYTHCRLAPDQEQRLCLMIANMLYQSGEKEQAREWAYRARTNQMGKPAYADMARQLLDDIRYETQGE